MTLLLFPTLRWSMRILRPVAEVSAWSVIHIGQAMRRGNGAAVKLVGQDHARRVTKTIQRPPDESVRSIAIAPARYADAL